MINIRALTMADAGRGVVYVPRVPRVGRREDGVITSFNDSFVFVRFAGDNFSKATDPRDLEWLGGAS